jgi:ferredoxin-like protein FixX
MCTLVCPHAVFAVDGGKARIADRDACMECGACAVNCRTGALSVESGVGCAYALLMAKLHRLWGGSGESACCG